MFMLCLRRHNPLGNSSPCANYLESPYPRFLALVGALLCLLCLLCFHLYLIGKGQTTNEWLRGERKNRGSQHTLDSSSTVSTARRGAGFASNFVALMMTDPKPQSLLLPMRQCPGMRDEELDVEAAEEAVECLQAQLNPTSEGGGSMV